MDITEDTGYRYIRALHVLMASLNIYGVQLKAEGGHHEDSYLLWMPGIQLDELEAFEDENGLSYYIYGDPGYPLNPQLLSSFKRLWLTADEIDFNRRYSSVRVMVEWILWPCNTIWRGIAGFINDRTISFLSTWEQSIVLKSFLLIFTHACNKETKPVIIKFALQVHNFQIIKLRGISRFPGFS